MACCFRFREDVFEGAELPASKSEPPPIKTVLTSKGSTQRMIQFVLSRAPLKELSQLKTSGDAIKLSGIVSEPHNVRRIRAEYSSWQKSVEVNALDTHSVLERSVPRE